MLGSERLGRGHVTWIDEQIPTADGRAERGKLYPREQLRNSTEKK